MPLPHFNFPHIGTFTWLTPPGPYRAMTFREWELAVDHIHTLLSTQGPGGPPQIGDQFNSGATSETTRTLKTIHTIHLHIHSNKADMIRTIMIAKWYSSYICLTGEEKPRKHFTQEKSPDWGSNPGPLRDKRACYSLLHSGGQNIGKKNTSRIKREQNSC